MKICLLPATTVFFFITNHAIRGKAIDTKSLPFECPQNCQSSKYKPVCSRGKSYANLCVLKKQICKGEATVEIYKDVENCPKYEKNEDGNGTSVETVDKNGVIFRTFPGMEKEKIRTEEKPKPPELKRPKGKSRKRNHDKRLHKRKRNKKYPKKENLSMCSDSTCNTQKEAFEQPVCIFGKEFPNYCIVKQLVCQSYLPTVSIILARPCHFFPDLEIDVDFFNYDDYECD